MRIFAHRPPHHRTTAPGLPRLLKTALASALALGTLIGLSGCDELGEILDGAQGGSSSSTAGAKLDGPKATATLEKLTVKGKAPASGYDRTRWFGKAWAYDYDGNGCRTRDDILARDMTNVKYAGGSKCKVASGTLDDPYDGEVDSWKVGKNSVDIDHLVALQNVWVSGAQYWTGTAGQRQRESIANDPLNLIAADASLNRTKGAANAAEWLPKNTGFRCQYVATQISVKYKYQLSVTSAEKKAMQKILSGCSDQKAAKVAPLKIKTGRSVSLSK